MVVICRVTQNSPTAKWFVTSLVNVMPLSLDIIIIIIIIIITSSVCRSSSNTTRRCASTHDYFQRGIDDRHRCMRLTTSPACQLQ